MWQAVWVLKLCSCQTWTGVPIPTFIYCMMFDKYFLPLQACFLSNKKRTYFLELLWCLNNLCREQFLARKFLLSSHSSFLCVWVQCGGHSWDEISNSTASKTPCVAELFRFPRRAPPPCFPIGSRTRLRSQSHSPSSMKADISNAQVRIYGELFYILRGKFQSLNFTPLILTLITTAHEQRCSVE